MTPLVSLLHEMMDLLPLPLRLLQVVKTIVKHRLPTKHLGNQAALRRSPMQELNTPVSLSAFFYLLVSHDGKKKLKVVNHLLRFLSGLLDSYHPLLLNICQCQAKLGISPGGLHLHLRRKMRLFKSSPTTEDSNLRLISSDETSVISKRPRPRMKLTVQMYKNHLIFKVFVTAPADTYRYPHERRCRVCQIEFSLKTKGSSMYSHITELTLI